MKFCFSPDAFSFPAFSGLLTEATFLQCAFCLPEIILTLGGAMTSITFTLELKFSTRLSVEHGKGGGNMEMAFLKSAAIFIDVPFFLKYLI